LGFKLRTKPKPALKVREVHLGLSGETCKKPPGSNNKEETGLSCCTQLLHCSYPLLQ